MTEEEESDKIVCPGKKDVDMIFEQIENGGEDLYAISWPSHGAMEVRDYLGKYKLMDRDKIVWSKFGRPVECDPKELYFEIRSFFEKYVYLSNPDLYDVATAYVFASYFQEAFEYATYLAFLGPIKSGKTKMLQLLEMLCYRGFKTSSVTPAAISRLIEYYQVTLLLDETDKIANEYKSDVIGILNEGQKQPSRYVRAERDGPGIEIRDVWRFKALAGTEKFLRSIASRSIPFPMRKPNRRMPKLNHEARGAASIFRNKLLWLRLKWNIQDSFVDDFLSDDRISEVFEPLFRISPCDETTEVIKRCALQVESSEIEEEKTSIEARIFRAILDAVNKGKMEGSKIRTADITDCFNEDLQDKEMLSRDSVGRICLRLGFQKTRVGKKGHSGIYWNERLIKDLVNRYLDNNDLAVFTSLRASEDSDVSALNNETNRESAEPSEASEPSVISTESMPEIEGTEPSEGTEGLRDTDHDAPTSDAEAEDRGNSELSNPSSAPDSELKRLKRMRKEIKHMGDSR